MATRWAVANGNWSNPAIWDGGTLPTSADDVFADGRTIAIDQNVNVLSLRSTNRGGGTLGGSFTMADPGYMISALGVGLLPGAGTLLTFTGNGTMTIIGDIVGASGVTVTVFANGTSPTVNVTGRVSAGGGAGQVAVATSGTSATLNITGDVVASGATNALSMGNLNGAQSLTIVGNCYHSSTFQNFSSSVRMEGANATATVIGRIENANSGAPLVYMIGSASLLTVIGSARAGMPTGTALSHAIRSDATTNGVILQGDITDHGSGTVAIYTRVFRMTATSNGVTRYATSDGSGSLVSRVSSNNATGMPNATDVRRGVFYGYNNEVAGTLTMPPTQAVKYGTPVGATVGSGEFDLSRTASVLAEAVASGMTEGSRQ